MHRVMVLFTAKRWGLQNPILTYKQRVSIKKVECRLISYDYGYVKSFATTQFNAWDDKVNTSIKNGSSSSSIPTVTPPLAPNHKGTASYSSKIDKGNPGYIRRLFRYAQNIKGALATFDELAQSINVKSETIDNQPTINLGRRQLQNWFTDQGDKEFVPTTKPLGTPEHIEKRNKWVRQYFDLLTDIFAPVAYLEEKWFYTTNRC